MFDQLSDRLQSTLSDVRSRGKLGESDVDAAMREVRARLLLDVSNAYWTVVSAQEELAVRQLTLQRGQQQLAQDQRRLEVGAGTEVDVLQSETNVATA